MKIISIIPIELIRNRWIDKLKEIEMKKGKDDSEGWLKIRESTRCAGLSSIELKSIEKVKGRGERRVEKREEKRRGKFVR